MTTNPQRDASADTPSDIFDMERPAKAQSVHPETTDAPDAARPASSPIAAALQAARPLHVMLLGVAAAAVWIGWPYVFTSDAVTAPPASRLMLSTTAEPLPKTTAPASLPITNTAPQQVVTPPTNDARPSPPPGQPPFTQPMPAVRHVPTQRPRTALHTSRKVPGGVRPETPIVGPASSKFSLNTVYAGQAWIQDDERTYVVQAGDTVKGIAIVSIDARGRRVFTSQGVIR